jgi:HEAT repeat protein
MPIQAACPHCQAKHTLDDALVGKKIHCPQCMLRFRVDAAGPQPAPPQPAPPQPAPPQPAPPVARPVARPLTPPVARPVPAPSLPANKRLRIVVGSCLGVLVLAAVGVGIGAYVIVRLMPTELERNVSNLRSDDPAAREKALEWFAEAPVTDDDRAHVTAALEPMVTAEELDRGLNPDLLLRTYLRWANQDNAPVLIDLLRKPSRAAKTHRNAAAIMEALGKTKDPRAVDVLVEQLSNPSQREDAATALRLLGTGAEPAVLERVFDDDPATADRARQLLADYGVRPGKVAAAALSRLKSNQPEVRRGVLAWFVNTAPDDDAQKVEPAKALAKLLDDPSSPVHAQVLRALRLWSTKDCLPQLLEFAQREAPSRDRPPHADDAVLIDLLAQYPIPAVADAIALRLKDRAQRSKAAQALLSPRLGPVAVKAVLPYLNHPDPEVHKEARSLLSASETAGRAASSGRS